VSAKTIGNGHLQQQVVKRGGRPKTVAGSHITGHKPEHHRYTIKSKKHLSKKIKSISTTPTTNTPM
jgi:hypothetical protein